MKDLFLEATEYTPKISFQKNGKLSLAGISIPENIISLNKVITEWVDEFLKTQPQNIEFTFDVEYLNTATTRIVMTLLKKIKTWCDGNSASLNIVWHYEDEDVFELGEEFSEAINLKFNFEAKSPSE